MPFHRVGIHTIISSLFMKLVSCLYHLLSGNNNGVRWNIYELGWIRAGVMWSRANIAETNAAYGAFPHPGILQHSL